MKKTVDLDQSLVLRRKAIELLKKKSFKPTLSLSEADILKLVHELEVHQIELELQNEELKQAKARELELATEKYVELYDFAPSGYFTLSKEGQIVDLNLSGAKLLGRERSRLKGSMFGFFVSGDTKQIFNLYLGKVFDSRTLETCELILSSSGNSPIYVHLSGIVTENREHCLVSVIDITERIQTELELIIAKEKAEESDHLKSAFLANMSHEIRTPINGILGFAALLKDPELTEYKKQRYISIIERSGARLLNIINDIIDISKIESGQMKVSLSKTNVNEQIKYIYSFFKPEAEQKGLHIFYHNSLTSGEVFIQTDREKIYAILTNLVKNAIKFTQKGYIVFGYVKKDKFLEFYVKDTGMGIHPEQLKIIFERFRQASDQLTRNYEGAGLGLSISKAYVEMLGGKIWAESIQGEGSVFYFTLPYKPEKEIEIDSTNAVSPELNLIPLNNLKILIAEDDEFSEMMLILAVEIFSRELIKVKSGIEAVNACRNLPDIDLVLMDIKMPEMDGYEATRQIRQFNKNVVIIAQTAFGLSNEKEKALEAGCDDYISKPLNINSLISIIKKYFHE